jgi:hypothetical protein
MARRDLAGGLESKACQHRNPFRQLMKSSQLPDVSPLVQSRFFDRLKKVTFLLLIVCAKLHDPYRQASESGRYQCFELMAGTKPSPLSQSIFIKIYIWHGYTRTSIDSDFR